MATVVVVFCFFFHLSPVAFFLPIVFLCQGGEGSEVVAVGRGQELEGVKGSLDLNRVVFPFGPPDVFFVSFFRISR